jgi:patatin-like phospholipase/acyl hydrolase
VINNIEERYRGIKLVDVVAATMAAPTLFPKKKIKKFN